ncbi:MAG: hypothetical protein IPN85_10580 [Flavobacteriales bacterium]|nr:hypothetical protein [Flavobacteriales bacterium]
MHIYLGPPAPAWYTWAGRTPMKALRISLFVLVCLAALGFYGMRHFARDKQALLELKAMVGNGDLGQAFQRMDSIGGFQNPLIDLSYQRWKKKLVARFITHEEVLENTSGNTVVNDVSNIYRAYWRAELMKTDPQPGRTAPCTTLLRTIC